MSLDSTSSQTDSLGVARGTVVHSGRNTLQRIVGAYAGLMKLHVASLLLVVTVLTMVIAAHGLPKPSLLLATLLGGLLASGSAGTLNCYLDRDIDRLMRRTRNRSLPSGRVSPLRALLFGLALGLASVIEFSLLVNLLAALLAFMGLVFYVLVYTAWLKRRTPQNIVIGGVAGGVPALVGWAAVTHTVALPAVLLCALIVCWTPPHFWALSLLIQEDYQHAGVPMLPVVRGEAETRQQIALYSLLLVAVSLVLCGAMGPLSLVSAVLLGGTLLALAFRLLQTGSRLWASRLFRFSNLYLALLFAAMALGRLIT